MKLRQMMAVALALATVPAAAQQSGRAAEEAPDYAAMSDGELGTAVHALGDDWLVRCEVSEPLLAEFTTRPAGEQYESGLLLARTVCADKHGDYRRAADALAEYESLFDPWSFIWYGLYLDTRLDDPDAALARLERFAEMGTAEVAERLEIEQFYAAVNLGRKHGREDEFEEIALRLFRSPLYGEFSAKLHGPVAFTALDAAISAGDEAIVSDILGQVRNPAFYPELLSLRKYEPVWPLIEQRVGENFNAITEAYLQWAEARYENAPADRDRFSDLVSAHYFAGRFEEAAALAQQWRERSGSFDRIEEGDAWALNMETYALDALGRFDEADAVFDRLAALPVKENPWVVNFLINRGVRLVMQGRYAEGLDATALARKGAEKYGTTYAKMLIARDRTCALHKLGRDNEIAGELAFLRDNKVENIGVVVAALMCLDERDEALAMLRDGLRQQSTRLSAISSIAPDEFDFFGGPSVQPQARELLETSPALRAEYERWAREIPVRFLPAASIKRATLNR